MARCRVCHRELHNAAHIAAGVGPICAQRAARFGVGTGEREQATYPAERLARIERMLARLWQWTNDQEFNRRLAADCGTPDELALFTARVVFGWRWYARWQRIERQVKRLASTAA